MAPPPVQEEPPAPSVPWTDLPGSAAGNDDDADGYSGGNEDQGEENGDQRGGVQTLFRDDLSELSSIDDSALGDDVRA